MNRYLAGAYALGGQRPSFVALARERPLSVALAGSVVQACIGALEEKYMEGSVDSQQGARIREALRQLRNMSGTIDRCRVDFLPEEAADILGEAAAQAADETGHPHDTGTPDDNTGTGDDQSPFEGDDESLISDFGFELEPSTDVLNEDEGWGDFEIDDDIDLDTDEEVHTEVLGAFDMQLEQRKMNGLKSVTLSIARSMVKYGLAVIGQAIAQAETGSVSQSVLTSMAQAVPMLAPLASAAPSGTLPGETTRKNCKAHLEWHQNKLMALTGPADSTMYDSADDLKKWAMQAFIEANAVEEGAQWISLAWSAMWTEIAEGLKKIPAQLLKLPGKALEIATGVPWWGWYAGGAVVLGGLLFVIYKILAGPTGGMIVGGYLGGRRR